MTDRLHTKVKTGRAYRLTIHPIVSTEEPVARDNFGQRFRPVEPAIWAPCDLRFYDASTRLNTTARSQGPNDNQNIFVAQSLESSVTQTAASELALQRQIITNCDASVDSRYLYSQRPSYTRCWPLQDTTEIDGFNLTAYLRSEPGPSGARETRTYSVQSTLEHCRGMVPVASQLSAFDSYAAHIRWGNDAERTAARASIDRLNYEKFDGYTAARVQRDLTLSARVPPGRWTPGVANAYHYHPFECWNTTDYKVTTLDYYTAPETSLSVGCGEYQHGDCRVFLVPQRLKYVYQYWALYSLATLFLPPLLVPIPQTGTFLARMPFYPISFRFAGSTFTGMNDVAVSQFIGQSMQLGVSFAQDLATQYFSPYSAFVLNRRVEGRWSIYATNLKAGELAAIIDVVVNGATERRYVWRKKQMSRSQLIDYGPLDVTPMLYPMAREGGQFSMTQGPLTPP